MALRSGVAAVGAVLLLTVLLGVAGADSGSSGSGSGNCKTAIRGYSSVLGPAAGPAAASSRTADWANRATQPITQLILYGNGTCIVGVRVRFGSSTVLAGSDSKKHRVWSLALKGAEGIVRADVKARKCIEWVRLTTSKNRTVAAGNDKSSAKALTTRPAAAGAQLVTLRATTVGGAAAGQKPVLQQLQFGWGAIKCPAAVVPRIACPANPNMCNDTSKPVDLAYCGFNPPWSTSRCVGGCCVSTGRCASTSCSLSGLGSDVQDMACYGIGSGVSFSGSSNCAGLACKLYVPGCTTNAFGGNCVGIVWPVSGSAQGLDARAKKLLGYPCLDATPSSSTLTADGQSTTSSEGVYVAKLWTICDCMAVPKHGTPEAALLLPSIKEMAQVVQGNATKVDVLKWLSAFIPQNNDTGEPLITTFNQLIPSLNLSQIITLPDVAPIVIPEFNITLPDNIFPNMTDLSPAKLLANLTLDGQGLPAILRGLAGNGTKSPLNNLADLLDAVKGGKNYQESLKAWFSTLPKDIATPTGFGRWLLTLLPNDADGHNPLQPLSDAIQKIVAIPDASPAPAGDAAPAAAPPSSSAPA